MYNKCCVVNCGRRRKDVKFFGFPKNELELRQWLQCINCEYLRSLRFEDLHKNFVCEKHFEKRFLSSTTIRSRLRVGAYPTLFTESEITTGIPQTCIVTNKYPILDHNYTKKREHCDHSYCKVEVAEKRLKLFTKLNVAPSTTLTHPSTSGYGNASTPIPIQRETMIQSTPKLKVKRNRIIFKKDSLSPICAKLYHEYIKSQKQLRFTQRAKKALRFSKEHSFEKLTEKMNPLAKKLMWMQIRQCTKKTKGRRFSDEEKLIALSIIKQSPKCYKFLRKIFILPSKYTLNKMIADLNIDAGINAQVFGAIKQEINNWNETKKYCSILFDEVALETNLSYNKHKDLIDGFVELGDKTNDFADHALVFMLRGAIYKWQQPLAFFFCKGATSKIQLKKIIQDVIIAVGNTGLIPVALVCDQGTSFQSALKSLQEDTRREQLRLNENIDDVIKINQHQLSIIYDPPHLIKGLRNNFLNKNIKYENNISKWEDIVEVYKTDCRHAQMRLLPKLNDEHVIPEKIKKMKVKNCTRVFSKTVAATLSYTAQFSQYADGQTVSATLKNTADMVSFFDDLFDSVNGSSFYKKNNKGKPLRHAVSGISPHHAFWNEAINKLKKIRYIDSNCREKNVPSLINWIVTLKSYQRLWYFFKKNNVKIMRPRYFNSDPLENFFGQVRAYNFRNNNPNCHTFKCTFRSLLITRVIQFHSESYNCEEDPSRQLLKLKTLFEANSSNPEVCFDNDSCQPGSSKFHSVNENIHLSASEERLNNHTRAYTTGWVIRKVTKKMKCKDCEANLISQDEYIGKTCLSNWIACKEYKNTKEKKLTYPSERAVRLFGNITQEANNYLEIKPQQQGLIKKLKNVIKSKYMFDLANCEIHKDAVYEYFIDLTLRLTVFNWCNCINNILKGKDVYQLQNRNLPPMQLKAFNHYKTKLKNKRINK